MTVAGAGGVCDRAFRSRADAGLLIDGTLDDADHHRPGPPRRPPDRRRRVGRPPGPRQLLGPVRAAGRPRGRGRRQARLGRPRVPPAGPGRLGRRPDEGRARHASADEADLRRRAVRGRAARPRRPAGLSPRRREPRRARLGVRRPVPVRPGAHAVRPAPPRRGDALQELRAAGGSPPASTKGSRGVHFAVWAPNAERVSVVGNFNHWDGRRHPLRSLRRGRDLGDLHPGPVPGRGLQVRDQEPPQRLPRGEGRPLRLRRRAAAPRPPRSSGT